MYVRYDQHVAGIKGGKFTLPKYSVGLTCLKKQNKTKKFHIEYSGFYCDVTSQWELHVADSMF